jgi:hypothetical protein
VVKSFATRVDVEAPAQAVWDLLADVSHWPDWNSTVERVVGEIALGAKVTVFVAQSAGRAFPVRVTELDAPGRMVWAGGMPFGLFRGVRVFEVAASSAGTSAFSMRERYEGPLAALIGRSIPDLQPSFDEFARCLKRQAERVARA